MARRRTSDLGLTLMEVIIVMFIVALVSSTVIMSLPERASPLKAEADRLTQTLIALADRSVLMGQTHALNVDPDGYSSFVRIDGEWRNVPALSRPMPASLSLSLRRETRLSARALEERTAPDIIFPTVGVSLEGVLELTGADGIQIINLAELERGV